MSSLVDSHAHLSSNDFDHDRHDVIQRAFHEGITAILCPAELTDKKELQITFETIREYPSIIAAGGVHPHNAKDFAVDHLQHIKAFAEDKYIMAVGEIGLDFHYNFSHPDEQIKAFRHQLVLAQDIGLPAIIHSRNARNEVLHIIKEVGFTQGGILHCFTEDWEFANEMMAYGFLISFSGILTFPKAQSLRTVAAQAPIQKILVETDSPYLVPVPYRGKVKRNEPVYVKETARVLAGLRNMTLEEIEENTTHNFESLFQIEIKNLRC